MTFSYILLIINILLLVGGQMLWKSAVDSIGYWNINTMLTLIWSPKVIGGIALYGIATLLWLYILSKLPFSIAYPFQSLSYVLGVLMAALLFQEHVDWQQWLGVVVIIFGVFLIAK